MVAIPHWTPPGVRIVAAAATTSADGSWTVSPAGAVHAYGDAPFLGSMGGTPLKRCSSWLAALGNGSRVVSGSSFVWPDTSPGR